MESMLPPATTAAAESTGPQLDPEDFLSDSLQTLYNYQPITLTTAGATFKYTLSRIATCNINQDHHQFECGKPVTITLRTPDTAAANWALHASSIWMSSIYLCDHIADLCLEDHIKSTPPGKPLRVLELGASAGLPSILIAKLYPGLLVTASDYPDEALIETLKENVKRNGAAQRCRVVPYAWGTDPTTTNLLDGIEKFDVVVAADTLWNPDLHDMFIHALKSTLAESSMSRAYLVVGLHTGRYTIASFMNHVLKCNFDLHSVVEKEVAGSLERSWCTAREGEDDTERRRWVVWITLKWTR